MTSNPPAQRSTSTAVASATAQANKPPCNIHPTAVVAEKASITGTYQVDIGEHCILHPYAKIRAEGGKVSIGAFCTISEAAVVGSIAEHTGNVVLGDHVVIDSGAQVEAASIGDGTEVGIKAIVGHGTVIGKHCKIAPKWTIQPGQTLDDYTVVFGNGITRKNVSVAMNDTYRDAHIKGQEKHVEALKQKIANGAAKFSSV